MSKENLGGIVKEKMEAKGIYMLVEVTSGGLRWEKLRHLEL